MDWENVFGEAWFWAAMAIFWVRAALSLYGAPRRLIGEARRGTTDERRDGVGAAAFAYDLVRWRLGPGQPFNPGLLPLRWPMLGAAAAWLAGSAAFGDLVSLGLLTALFPLAAVTLALEPRLQRAVDAVRQAETERRGDRLADFADALDQCWRLRMAVVMAAIGLTLVASFATTTVPPVSAIPDGL